MSWYKQRNPILFFPERGLLFCNVLQGYTVYTQTQTNIQTLLRPRPLDRVVDIVSKLHVRDRNTIAVPPENQQTSQIVEDERGWHPTHLSPAKC